MTQETPLDRALRAFRPALFVLGVIAFPIWMVSYGWMIRALFDAAPLWLAVVAGLSHFICFLVIASLFDRQTERQNLR